MELENISSEHKEIIAQLHLNHAEKVNSLREQLQEAESCKSKAEKEVPLIYYLFFFSQFFTFYNFLCTKRGDM